ncbi:MAG: SulP family inorganic anion transporter, partial [Flavobacteriaceae bacterium]
MFKTLKADLPASIVVFFVALPLCLGIALASGAPLFSGLIAGIIGGIVVGAISGSQVGVSGPAAGLAAIVLSAITAFGDFRIFLVAVVLAGVIQVIMGIAKAGIIGYFFPSSVIKGMLTGIGIIIILKQIPHFFGYDADWIGDDAFAEGSGSNTFQTLIDTFGFISPGATLIAFIGLGVILLWDQVLAKKARIFTIIQGPIVAVFLGIVYAMMTKDNSTWSISSEHLVNVPVFASFTDFTSQFTTPAFSMMGKKEVWIVAFTIALVASLETLLSVEATDKLDPHKRVTPTNRELVAQGVGNIFSGLVGGLPVTQVIVRSSANIQSKNETKLSAIIHGFLLLIAVVLMPRVLNMIPLSVLASVLLVVG